MGQFSASGIYRAPGRLFVNPTDLSIAAPYGGTELGGVRSVVWDPGYDWAPIRGEEYHSKAVDGVRRTTDPMLSCIVRQDDAGILTEVWPSIVSGGREEPNSNKPSGALLSEDSAVVLFKANDVDQPSILLYRALMVLPQPQLIHSVFAERGYPLMMVGILSSDSKLYQWNQFSSLSL